DTWRDNVDIKPTEFYNRLTSSSLFPTTSQPNVGEFYEFFRSVAQNADSIVAVLISDALSGTIDSAKGAVAMIDDLRITVVDSMATSMMLGFTVLEAAKLAADGASHDEVVAAAEKAVDETGILFLVDTLEFLHRGGRIGGAAKYIGSALNLKPILEINDGVIMPLAKVRTTKKAYEKTIEILKDRLGDATNVKLAVIHAGALERANEARDDLAKRFNLSEVLVTDVSPAIGAHAGPGTIGFCYQAFKD
ncbi:MAG: DegV family protein, partial [Chloroflexota bacterium]